MRGLWALELRVQSPFLTDLFSTRVFTSSLVPDVTPVLVGWPQIFLFLFLICPKILNTDMQHVAIFVAWCIISVSFVATPQNYCSSQRLPRQSPPLRTWLLITWTPPTTGSCVHPVLCFLLSNTSLFFCVPSVRQLCSLAKLLSSTICLITCLHPTVTLPARYVTGSDTPLASSGKKCETLINKSCIL